MTMMVRDGEGRVSRVLRAVRDHGVLAIVRASDTSAASRQAERLVDAGVRVIEVSLVTPDAFRVIADLSSDGELVAGVGTAMTVGQVETASDAGASFVVSPVTDAAVIGATLARGMASFPGAGTVTEMVHAERLGAHMVKVFPASVFGPSGVRGVLAALPHLELIPTGGIELEQIPAYLEAGARAVGMGSPLAAAAERDPSGLREALRGASLSNRI